MNRAINKNKRNIGDAEIVLGTALRRSGNKQYVVDIGSPHLLYGVLDRNDGKYPEGTGVLVAIPRDTKTRPFIMGESGSKIPTAVRHTV